MQNKHQTMYVQYTDHRLACQCFYNLQRKSSGVKQVVEIIPLDIFSLDEMQQIDWNFLRDLSFPAMLKSKSENVVFTAIDGENDSNVKRPNRRHLLKNTFARQYTFCCRFQKCKLLLHIFCRVFMKVDNLLSINKHFCCIIQCCDHSYCDNLWTFDEVLLNTICCIQLDSRNKYYLNIIQ